MVAILPSFLMKQLYFLAFSPFDDIQICEQCSEKAALFSKLMTDFHSKLNEHPSWMNATPEIINTAVHCLESRVLSEIFDRHRVH